MFGVILNRMSVTAKIPSAQCLSQSFYVYLAFPGVGFISSWYILPDIWGIIFFVCVVESKRLHFSKKNFIFIYVYLGISDCMYVRYV